MWPTTSQVHVILSFIEMGKMGRTNQLKLNNPSHSLTLSRLEGSVDQANGFTANFLFTFWC